MRVRQSSPSLLAPTNPAQVCCTCAPHPGAGGQGVGGLQGDLEEPPVGRQGPHPCVEIQLPSENLKHKHRCYGITLWHKSPQLR